MKNEIVRKCSSRKHHNEIQTGNSNMGPLGQDWQNCELVMYTPHLVANLLLASMLSESCHITG